MCDRLPHRVLLLQGVHRNHILGHCRYAGIILVKRHRSAGKQRRKLILPVCGDADHVHGRVAETGERAVYDQLHHAAAYHMAVHPVLARQINRAILARRHIHRVAVVGIILILIIFLHEVGENAVLHPLFFLPVVDGNAVSGSEEKHVVTLTFHQIRAPLHGHLFRQRTALHVHPVNHTSAHRCGKQLPLRGIKNAVNVAFVLLYRQ